MVNIQSDVLAHVQSLFYICAIQQGSQHNTNVQTAYGVLRRTPSTHAVPSLYLARDLGHISSSLNSLLLCATRRREKHGQINALKVGGRAAKALGLPTNHSVLPNNVSVCGF